MVGCTVFYTVRATDGTDLQSASGCFTAAAVNKAGTTTANASAASVTANIASSGTLDVTAGATTSGTSLALQFTADSSLSSPTVTVEYTVVADGTTTISPQ
jgi:hypothetical protein